MPLLGFRFFGLCAAGALLCRVLPGRCFLWVLAACNLVLAAANGALSFGVTFGCLMLTYFTGKAAFALRDAGKSPRLPVSLAAAVIVGAMLCFRGKVPGISFFGLMLLGYLFDVASGACERPVSALPFAACGAFFPLMSQGPIVRIAEFSETAHGIRVSFETALNGLYRILWGLVKKLILAERLGILVRAVYAAPESFSSLAVWSAAILSAFEIYADFSGCMDIVLGVAALFGLKPGENFKRPYLARDFTDYWKRWHITMGAWFRTYVFYPLAASAPVRFLTERVWKTLPSPSAKRAAVVAVPLLATWLLTGIWHGSGMHYALSGLMNGLVLLAGTLLPNGMKRRPAPLAVLHTFTVGALIRVMFRAESVVKAGAVYRGLFSFRGGAGFGAMGLDVQDALVALCFLLVLIAADIYEERGRKIGNPTLKAALAFLGVCALILFGHYGPGYAPGEFFYARF
ncbi:MAG: MBOAT family O-acyltransferase [Clostridia bacterium]|nr:MBOAT family O-acyltransferase [Clostridia bacterium]